MSTMEDAAGRGAARGRPRWYREREGDREVSWLELFYDLVFVAALIQLGGRLGQDVSPSGVVEFVVLFALLWWAWTGTTFYTNRIQADDMVQRLLVFVQMFAIGNLAIQLDGAFAEESATFATAYFVIRLTLVLMYARAYRAVPAARPLARRFGLAFGAGAVLWGLSILVPPPARFVLWAAAIAADIVGRLIRRGRQEMRWIPADPDHMSERYALFTLIVLGETFIKTIDGLVEEGISLDSQMFGGLGFVVLIALWWTYFDDVAGARIRGYGQSLRNSAVWIYTHLPLTMALTAFGVAVQHLALLDLSEDIPAADLWLLAGSVAVALVSIAALDAVTDSRTAGVGKRDRVVPRLLAAGALLMVAALGSRLPALLEASLLAAVAVAQMAHEVVAGRRFDRRVRARVREEVGARVTDAPCLHLAEAGEPRPRTPEGCEECLATGQVWVHLRLCASCGHVGCCEDSTGRHASGHGEAAGHPVIRSLEPGEDWAWCYVDGLAAEPVTSSSRGNGSGSPPAPARPG